MSERDHSSTVESSTPVEGGIYFGCWDREGHGFHLPNGRSATYRRSEDVVPWGYNVERLPPKSIERQGAAALHHKDGWTALAVHDYSVDRRPGSKSVFCFPVVLTFEEALYEAGRTFSEIIARVGQITLVEP